MKFQLMETAAKNSKPVWDTIVAIGGGVAVFMQSALSLEVQAWAQVFGGFGLGIFCLTRVYFWWKHDGYEHKKTSS